MDVVFVLTKILLYNLYKNNCIHFCSSISRIKGRLWPAVPDPANSSIKRWTSESTQVHKLNLFNGLYIRSIVMNIKKTLHQMVMFDMTGSYKHLDNYRNSGSGQFCGAFKHFCLACCFGFITSTSKFSKCTVPIYKEYFFFFLQDTNPSWDNEEPDPIYLSRLSLLDMHTKLGKEEDDLWLNSAENTSDLGESICGSPFIPGYTGSNSDSVPYATVIFSGPYNTPTHKDPQVYLRSESTQPLLEAEESFSPKCYQNIAAHETLGEQCFFGPSHDCVPEEGDLWDDFPFLRAMTDAQNDKMKEIPALQDIA